MKKKVIVISLGGSLIIPNEINTKYLLKFKKTIKKFTKDYKFVIVTGGGGLARIYINSLKSINASRTMQSLAGIAATRNNARFMNYFFNYEPKAGIPLKMSQIKKYLRKNDFVFCGGLSYRKRQTSDSTAAQVTKHLKCEFVNITNVKGLYNKDPKKHKNAKFIPKITWQNFYKIANKTKFNPGQHFVLDQTASLIIMNHKIKTTIIGTNIKNFENYLLGKKFIGTIIVD